MSRSTYDNWERLVYAVLRKQHDRELAYAESLESSFNSSTSTDFSTRFSLEPQIHQVNFDGFGFLNESVHSATPLSSRRKSSSDKAQKVSFKELKKSTQSFRYDLLVGRGAFGDVYKGWIKESKSTDAKPGLIRFFIRWINESNLTATKPGFGIPVAVKKLRPPSNQGKTEWLAEINYLSELRHSNIVKLIGYGGKENDHLLVYEFAQNGSLYENLNRSGHLPLSWATRIKVALGAARALSFLHDHNEKQIIHRGCNSHNILLDEDFNAILSDFGLAMTLPRKMTHIFTTVVGTTGYLDPEYCHTGKLTAKCDVYGFGVVLLELISGRQVYDILKVAEELDLVEWAKTYLPDKEEVIAIMDTKLRGHYPPNQALKTAMLALQCLGETPEERPAMSDVVVALEQLKIQK